MVREDGNTALSLAIGRIESIYVGGGGSRGHVVKALIKAGAVLLRVSNDKDDLLSWAYYLGQDYVVKALLADGADAGRFGWDYNNFFQEPPSDQDYGMRQQMMVPGWNDAMVNSRRP